MVVVHAVDTLVVAVQGEVWGLIPEPSHFDCLVHGGGGVVALGVDPNLLDEVGVSLEALVAALVLVLVPELDEHVVRACEDAGVGVVHGDVSHVVGVGVECVQALQSFVVEHEHLRVIRACDVTVLASHELQSSD